jgi:ornithine cyclodeaminase/alanine dehydrogenase-like protein (mu-crystallin family)
MNVYQNSDVFIESSVGIQTELRGIEAYVKGEVGEVILGRKQSDGRKTLFQSMGNAIEDGVMANLICEKFIRL